MLGNLKRSATGGLSLEGGGLGCSDDSSARREQTPGETPEIVVVNNHAREDGTMAFPSEEVASLFPHSAGKLLHCCQAVGTTEWGNSQQH